MFQILPNLHLSNWSDVQSLEGYPADPDVFIVNCTKDLPMLDGYRCMRVPVHDNGAPESMRGMCDAIGDVVDSIQRELADGSKVIVHCLAGQQRSAAVVACFLVESFKMSPQSAIDAVKERKRDAFLTGVNFREVIEWSHTRAQIVL